MEGYKTICSVEKLRKWRVAPRKKDVKMLFYKLSSERQLSYSAILCRFLFIVFISPSALLPHLVFFSVLVYLSCLHIFGHLLPNTFGCISYIPYCLCFLLTFLLVVDGCKSSHLFPSLLFFISLCLTDERVISLFFAHFVLRLFPD